MTERILVPIDGSPLSYRALRHALDTYEDAEITVFHVSDLFDPGRGTGEDPESLYEPMIGSEGWYEMEEQTRSELFSRAHTIAEEYDREIETEAEIGDPQRVIPDYAEEEDVDHVVIGVHGREDEGRSLVGRVAETIVFRSPVSVTVIR